MSKWRRHYREPNLLWLDLFDATLYGIEGDVLRREPLRENRFTPSEPTHEMVASLETALAAGRERRPSLWLVAPAGQTIIRSIYFPARAKGRLLQALHWEWQEYFPLPPENFIFDTLRVSPADGEGWFIWVFACPRSYLIPWLQLCEDAGVMPAGVDLAALCLASISPVTEQIIIEGTSATCAVSVFRKQQELYHSVYSREEALANILPTLASQGEMDAMPILVRDNQREEIVAALHAGGISPERIALAENLVEGFVQRHRPEKGRRKR